MIEQDTIKLLRECDAGIQMGIQAINDVLPYVSSEKMKQELIDSRAKHEKIMKEIHNELDRFQDDGKHPNPLVKGMSWIETNMKLTMNDSDKTVADLLYDGCNMGVKSLSKYLNQYKAAEERAKDMTKKLITIERDLAEGVRYYL